MRRTVMVMLGTAVLILVAYWATWFAHRSWLASDTTQAYYDFENAFPLADGLLAVACVLALVALARRTPSALLWLLVGGGAGLYLFAMDLLYDLEHGIFGKGSAGATELVIVLVELAFSLTILVWAWRSRAALLGQPAGRKPEQTSLR